MNALFNGSLNAHVFLWGLNVLLQVTVLAGLTAVVGAFLKRRPTIRHAMLAGSLMLMAFTPVITLAMQVTGRSLISISLFAEHPQDIATGQARGEPG